MNDIKEASERTMPLPEVIPSLVQLSLNCISKFPLWSFLHDIPETSVPGLLEKIRGSDFDLDLLPNLLPASLQYLDLSGYSNLTEDTLLVIIKKCFSITQLILDGAHFITENILPKILWHLPDLLQLQIGAGVRSISRLDIIQRPTKLLYLKIKSAMMDSMWLEQLRYFPQLRYLKLTNVAVPLVSTASIKLPPNLEKVSISTYSDRGLTKIDTDLFSLFLTSAPNLEEFSFESKVHELQVEEIGSVVAQNLRVLRVNNVMVSQKVLDVLYDACQKIETVAGLSLIIDPTTTQIIGRVSFTNPLGNTDVHTYDYHRLKIPEISQQQVWEHNPISLTGITNLRSTIVMPMDPSLSLTSLSLSGNSINLVAALKLLPNLEVLRIQGITITNMDDLPADLILAPKLKRLALVTRVPRGFLKAISTSRDLKHVAIDPSFVPELGLPNLEVMSFILDTFIEQTFPFLVNLNLVAHSTHNVNKTIWIKGSGNSSFKNSTLKVLTIDGQLTAQFLLAYIDFNPYKRLTGLHLSHVFIGQDVVFNTNLRSLSVKNLNWPQSTTIKIPLGLCELTWMDQTLTDEIAETAKKMKNLRVVCCTTKLEQKLRALFGNDIEFKTTPHLTRFYEQSKYVVPRKKEVSSTNFFSAFNSIKNDPMEKLDSLLKSSGSAHSLRDLQLMAEMYSKQEISLRAEQPVVHVRISAVSLGDKSFDLVIPPRTILDISQYDKTVEELKLANTYLIQKMREATPAENEMKTFGLYHSKLMSMGKSGSMNNSQDNMKMSQNDIVPNNNTSIMDQSTRVPDDEDNDLSDHSGSDSEMDDVDNQDDFSDNNDDDDDDLDMYISYNDEPKPEEILPENKFLLDQMNASAMLESREIEMQKQQELIASQKRQRIEELRQKHMAEQEAQRMREFQRQRQWAMPAQHHMNGGPIITSVLNMNDEEYARMLQAEYFDEDLL